MLDPAADAVLRSAVREMPEIGELAIMRDFGQAE